MTKLEAIPANVRLCHKNYDIAKELLNQVSDLVVKRPFFIEKAPFDKILEMFDAFVKTQTDPITPNWEFIESFFEDLKNSNTEDAETVKNADGTALLNLDSPESMDDDESDSVESILDLTDNNDRELKDLKKQILKDLKDANL